MLNAVSLLLHFPSYTKVENLDCSSVMLSPMKRRKKNREARGHMKQTTTYSIFEAQAFAFRMTYCNPRKSCFENYSKQGSKHNQMKQTQKSKTQQNREVKKSLKCTQRVVFYTWWSFRFSLHVSLPSQKFLRLQGHGRLPWKGPGTFPLASKRKKSPGHMDREGTVKPSPSGSLRSGREMPAHPNVWFPQDQTVSNHICWLNVNLSRI